MQSVCALLPHKQRSQASNTIHALAITVLSYITVLLAHPYTVSLQETTQSTGRPLPLEKCISLVKPSTSSLLLNF